MYKIVYGLLYILSLLPLRVLYVISDAIYFLIYHIFGYRKAVVKANLDIAFPGKTDQEKNSIAKQFYKNFIDNFIETLKLLSGGTSFATRHLHVDPSLLQSEFAKGNRMQIHLGHNFNWELANITVSVSTSYPLLIVYLPVKNKIFDRLMLKIRSVSGNIMLPSTDMKQAFYPYRNLQYLLALIADQVPGDVSKAYWLNFFGKPTPFMRGPERGAVAGNLSVVFAHTYKVKRGQYQLMLEHCTDAAGNMPKGELTRRYVRFLERVIREHPEMWLWSHRRWKREWKPEYSRLWIDERDPHP